MNLRVSPRSHVAPALALVFVAAGAFAAPQKEYSNQELERHDFKDGNLNNARFDEAHLAGANFRNATLKGASFRNAKLNYAILAKATLDNADFTGADLTAVDWTDAKAWYAKLVGTEIDLAGAVPPIDLNAIGIKTDFRTDALLQMSRRNDSGALSFHYADMRRCRILGNAAGVDFRGADLRGADFSKVEKLPSARLNGAKYDISTKWPNGVSFDPAQVRMEFVSGDAASAERGGETALSHHPLVGHWLLPKGQSDMVKSGSVYIEADHTYFWDDGSSPDPIKGTWEESGNNLILKKAANGENWTAHSAEPKAILLRSDKGLERSGFLTR